MKNYLSRFFLAGIAWMGNVYNQCAMCKAVVTNNNANNYDLSIGTGINTGILFLIVIVYLFWLIVFGKKIKPFLKEMLGDKKNQ